MLQPDTRIWIPEGKAGTAQTLEIMRDIVWQSMTIDIVQRFAASIIQSPESSVIDIDGWMRRAWRVQPDPDGVEWITLPEFQIRNGDPAGDCDDAATFAASLLCTQISTVRPIWLGQLVAIRLPGDTDFSHVWLQCVRNSDGLFVDIDPIVPVSELPITGAEEFMTLQVF